MNTTPATPHEEMPRDRKFVCDEMCQRLDLVNEEFRAGLELVSSIERSVTFFGSSKLTAENVHYRQAERLAYRLSSLGYTIITGGGPGIMEAANRGAFDAGGRSIGLNIQLPFEQVLNPYTTDNMGFTHFFTRKVALAFAAEAYVFFPGGYGTLDELFELLTLIQTKKIQPVPIILVGKDYWLHLNDFIKTELLDDHQAIEPEDALLYSITDDEDEVVAIVEHRSKTRVK